MKYIRIGFEADTLQTLDAMTATVQRTVPSVSRAAVIRWAVERALTFLETDLTSEETDLPRLAVAIAAHQPAGGRPAGDATATQTLYKQGAAFETPLNKQGADFQQFLDRSDLIRLASVAVGIKHHPDEARTALAELLPEIQAMREQGFSYQRIGEELNVATSTARRWLVKK